MPKGITIVGLGPGSPDLMTVEAVRVLNSASQVYVRTLRHPTLVALPSAAAVHSFDDVYEHAASFDAVYAEIAARIVELGSREEGVVYAVPGNPHVGEASVWRILDLAREQGLSVRIVEGLSFVEPVCAQLGIDPLNGLQIADATALAVRHYSEFNPDLPLLLGQLYSRDVAADVKWVLMTVYPDEHRVALVRAAGTPQAEVRDVPLYELDRCTDIDHLTALYVPPLPQPGSLAAFQEVVARLRAPDGCPWDREQTHSSLRPYLLEETYEVLQALDHEDLPALTEELGDLLLQVLLHTQIAIEDAEFRMADVVAHIVAKLKHRHPHVFGDTQVANSQEVLVNWERLKSEEKNHEPTREGVFSRIPQQLPALTRARSLQDRAARLGFEWPDMGAAWGKFEEESRELRQAEGAEARAAELGDVLFALVSLARWMGMDAECVLRGATDRFAQRFDHIVRDCAARGQALDTLSPSEWIASWERSKMASG